METYCEERAVNGVKRSDCSSQYAGIFYIFHGDFSDNRTNTVNYYGIIAYEMDYSFNPVFFFHVKIFLLGSTFCE